MSVVETGDLLIISLKRFTSKGKIVNPVEVPFNLTSADIHWVGSSEYVLYAMINHHGGSMNSGHYKAACQDT